MLSAEGAGVALAYEETGSGPGVLLLHGMADDHTAWRETAAALAQHARVVAPDRRGYGESGAPEPYERTTVAEQAEDAAALIGALGLGPVVACGVDVGALAILDLLLRHPSLVRAAVLVDPLAFALVADANEALAAEREALELALREGGPAEAVERWLRLHGAGDPARVARARRDARAFFADYGGQTTLALTRRELRGLDVPVAVLDGPDGPAHLRSAADALAGLLPDARRAGAEAPAEAITALLL
jgi:pimeloyl-ACP methyl ester carboxylesterase